VDICESHEVMKKVLAGSQATWSPRRPKSESADSDVPLQVMVSRRLKREISLRAASERKYNPERYSGGFARCGFRRDDRGAVRSPQVSGLIKGGAA
jgi:hypothetical protein